MSAFAAVNPWPEGLKPRSISTCPSAVNGALPSARLLTCTYTRLVLILEILSKRLPGNRAIRILSLIDLTLPAFIDQGQEHGADYGRARGTCEGELVQFRR